MTKTYINFNRFDGEELDKAFKEWALTEGFKETDSISVLKAPCITGHDSYIVSTEGK